VKHRNWLDIAEYIMLLGSGVGSLASVASQQVIYTAAPLSFLALLSVVNRHRLQQQVERVAPAVTRLDRRFSAEVVGLRQQVDVLPDADMFEQLSAIVTQKHQRAISQLAQQVSVVQTELANQSVLLETHNLTSIDQAIEHLQLRSTNLEEALSEVTAYLNQVAAATRVNELEGITGKFSVDLTHLKTEVGQLQTHLQSLLDEQRNFSPRTLQDQIDHLNRRLSNLPQPFDASLLKKDIDSLLNVVTDLVSRRELARVAAEVEKLHQQNRSLEQAITVVRLASNVLRKQLDTVSAKVYTKATLLPVMANAQAETEPNEDLKRAMTKLAKGLVALQKRFNQLSTSPDPGAARDQLEQWVATQMAALQQQLVTVQQATQMLAQEQHDLRQVIDRLPESGDRTLSTQLSALIARIDWAEQRITQAEGFWHTLQAQVEASLKHQLESLTQPVIQDLVAQHLQQLAIASDSSALVASTPRSTEPTQPMQQLAQDNLKPGLAPVPSIQQGWHEEHDPAVPILPAQALEQLNLLRDRVEWAETHLGTLQQQISDQIQPRLDELSQQVQGLSPQLDVTALVDESQSTPMQEPVTGLAEPSAGDAIKTQFGALSIATDAFTDPVEPQGAAQIAQEYTGIDAVEAELLAASIPVDPVSNPAEAHLPTIPIQELEPDSGPDQYSDHASETTWQEIPPTGRALLDAALAQTNERIIIVSPYPTPETFDAALLEQFETVLQRGAQIDIGWGHLVDEHQVRLPRCLHQPMIDLNGQGFLPRLLQQLAQLKQRYRQQFRFKILGTHENFVVCDLDFAAFGIFPIPGATSAGGVALRNDDPLVVQSLIDHFDEPEPDPNNPIALFNRGVTRFDLGDKHGAIADLSLALQGNPDEALIFNNRGLARFELGDLPPAMRDFNYALQLNPHLAVAFFNRGCTRTDLGDKLGAIADFSAAIDLQPDFSLALFCRAIAHTRLDNRAAAIDDFSAVLALNPHHPMALFYRGVARFRIGHLHDAALDLSIAHDLFKLQHDKPNQLRTLATLQLIPHQEKYNQPNEVQPLWPL
jgi:tetratricopeptide (TPR) repeat protein